MTTIKEIADGRGTPGAILISFVSPSGAMAIPVEDGAIACRAYLAGCVLHLDDPSDGLIVEMRTNREPLPWRTKQQREDAIVHLRDHRGDLDADLRDRLVSHVSSTAWYE